MNNLPNQISKPVPIKESFARDAWIDQTKYIEMYKQSIDNPDGFWRKQGRRIDWMSPYTQVKNTTFEDSVGIRWFEDGTLNASFNCIDRHLEARGDQVAIVWEGDELHQDCSVTYRELHREVCKFANVLKSQQVKRGDVVTIYMPMVVESVIAMLACARIGAIHAVVFGGFSPEALAGRIVDCQPKIIITANEGIRGGKSVPLKTNVDEALLHPGTCSVERVIVLDRTEKLSEVWNEHRDIHWNDLMQTASEHCVPEEMNAEDPLFILYTSGSTGNPKGVVHTTGGYLVYASMTHEYVFDYKEAEVYWCTADIGWITGHTYFVYGPLANGATSLMYEGVPNYPDATRMAQIIEKHQVNILYTAPTAIRALMAEGDKAVSGFDRKSLRLLGSVGEPINPEAWSWYHRKIGEERCPIVDTWWQTETGGIMITPLPGAMELKPGSACRPFFGVNTALVDDLGNLLEGETEGNLVITDSWPGQSRTLYGDHQRFIKTYFSTFKGMYFAGDGARRDADGDYWITGRVDDVLNVSGHRMGTAEIESALVAHSDVAEAAVVGIPHDVKGQGIYVYVTLNQNQDASEVLRQELRKWVRKTIGPIATPDVIQWAPGLPKTRSGKIMRRILRKVAAAEYDGLGDTSTLADPEVVDQLVATHKAISGLD